MQLTSSEDDLLSLPQLSTVEKLNRMSSPGSLQGTIPDPPTVDSGHTTSSGEKDQRPSSSGNISD